MKPQLFLAFLLTLVIHTYARVFPYSPLELKDYHKTKVDMLIRAIYWQPARSPPPALASAPTKKQMTLSDCSDDTTGETSLVINYNNRIIYNNNCRRTIRSPLPPPPRQITVSHGDCGRTKEELSQANRLSPPPPPISSPTTGQSTPVTLCMHGRPCEGGDNYLI